MKASIAFAALSALAVVSAQKCVSRVLSTDLLQC